MAEELAESENQEELLPRKFDQLIVHNDLVSRLLEQTNACFGLIILIVSVIDFSLAIFYFYQIYISLKSKEMAHSSNIAFSGYTFLQLRRIIFTARNSSGEIILEIAALFYVKLGHVLLRLLLI